MYVSKNIFKVIFLILAVLICGSFNAQAIDLDYDEKNSYEEQIKNFYEESGASELYDTLPKESQDLLSKTGIYEIDTEAILNLSIDNILNLIWEGIIYEVKKPLRIFLNLVGIILLSAMVNAMQSEKNQTGQIFTLVSTLCISAILIAPVIDVINDVSETLKQVSDYMLSFIPVYAGIITASGQPLTAFTYNSILVVVVESFLSIATSVLIPLSGIYLALMLVSNCTDQINVGGLIKGIRTTILWILGFIMTLFIGLLTIKSFVAKGADSVSLRAGKYILSSAIPLVGSSISDAFSIIQSSLSVIKSTVGVFGIISILTLFLPCLISLSLMSISINFAKFVSEIMEVKKLSLLFECTNFCLSLVLSITLMFNVMLIICTSLMLILGGGE